MGENSGNGRLLARIDERTKLSNEKLDKLADLVAGYEKRLRVVEAYQATCRAQWDSHAVEHEQHEKTHDELARKFRNLDLGGFAASIVAAVVGLWR